MAKSECLAASDKHRPGDVQFKFGLKQGGIYRKAGTVVSSFAVGRACGHRGWAPETAEVEGGQHF